MSTRHNVVLDVWFHDLSLEELPESWLVLEREGDEERAVRFDQVEATIDLDAEPNNAPDCLSALAPAFRATGPASRTQRRWDLQAATQWRGPKSARYTLTTCRNFVPQAHAGTAIDRSKQSNCPELRESCSVDAVSAALWKLSLGSPPPLPASTTHCARRTARRTRVPTWWSQRSVPGTP
jgi:hypothetical protein